MSFLNQTSQLNNLKTRTAMNAKILLFVICVEAFTYFLLYNFHDCTFKGTFFLSASNFSKFYKESSIMIFFSRLDTLLVDAWTVELAPWWNTYIHLKKRLWHRCFPVNFAKFLRTHFLTEHLWWLLLSHFIQGIVVPIVICNQTFSTHDNNNKFNMIKNLRKIWINFIHSL